jgi:hypothetical protein
MAKEFVGTDTIVLKGLPSIGRTQIPAYQG